MVLERFIVECEQAIVNPTASEDIEALVSDVVADPDRLRCCLDGLLQATPTGSILYRSNNLFIFQSCLQPGLVCPPHDHGMWSVIGLYGGQEDNMFHKVHNGTLEEVGARSLRPTEVLRLEKDVIHSVSNPLDEISFAIHVYGGDLLSIQRSMWHPFSLEKIPFELSQFMKFTEEMTRAYKA